MRSALYATDSPVSCATRVVPRSDPLSDALECLSLRCWIPGRFELTAPWGLRSATRLGWYYLVMRPPCHLTLDDHGATIVASGGDLFMVFPGRKHTLRHGGEGPIASIQTLLVPRHFETRDALVHGGGGAPTRLICGCFLLDGLENSPLHAVLPAFIHVRCAAEQPLPYMTHIVRLLELEATAGGRGRSDILNRLMRILLLKALQHHMSALSAEGVNWLTALAEPGIGQAIEFMHAQPEAPWTVASLAGQVAMARSTFSARFTARVGMPPLEYLTRWRLQKASLLLRTTRSELKEIAARVGYESTSAFSKAFARWAGAAPGAYRRAAAPAGQPRPGLPPM
jgi:AraC-like DNA-binding protein